MITRICKACCQAKPEIAFGIDRKRKDGLNSNCRDCHAKRARKFQKPYRRAFSDSLGSKSKSKWPPDAVRCVIAYGRTELNTTYKQIAEELCLSVGRVQQIDTLGMTRLWRS